MMTGALTNPTDGDNTMPGAPLTLFEREEIGLALLDDRAVAWAVIARRIRRHPTTRAPRDRANGGCSAYRPAFAEQRSERCLRRPRPALLARPGELRDRVTRELKLGRSPEAIWADLIAEGAESSVCCRDDLHRRLRRRIGRRTDDRAANIHGLAPSAMRNDAAVWRRSCGDHRRPRPPRGSPRPPGALPGRKRLPGCAEA